MEFMQRLFERWPALLKTLFQGRVVMKSEGISQKFTKETADVFSTIHILIMNCLSFDESIVKFLSPVLLNDNNQYSDETLGKFVLEDIAKLLNFRKFSQFNWSDLNMMRGRGSTTRSADNFDFRTSFWLLNIAVKTGNINRREL
jgi:hypothetical protein